MALAFPTPARSRTWPFLFVTVMNDQIHQQSLRDLKKSISEGKTYLTTTSTLVFTCGARPNDSRPGGRDRLMSYAKKHLTKYNFFIAEKFFEICQNKKSKDLLSLEDQLTKFCDCIIIVLESESAYSELGAFAINSKLARKLLIVNDKEFISSKSFISLGPLAKVDRISIFKPTIYTNIKSILTIMPEVESRLERITKQRKVRINIRNIDEFSKLPPKTKMVFILDLLSLLHPITHQELIIILKEIYGDYNFDINVETGLLIALGLVDKIDNYYVRVSGDYGRFIVFYGINEISLRANIINHYHKYSRYRSHILKNKIKL